MLEYEFKAFCGRGALPPHYHPQATERFHVLEGRCAWTIGGRQGESGAGEVLTLPANVVHEHPWNIGDTPLRLRQEIEVSPPDLARLTASLQGAITIFGLARDGRVNRQGMPNLLQLAVILAPSMPVTFVQGPPAAVQRVVMSALAVAGRLAGYRAAYPRYGVLAATGFIPPKTPR